MPTNPRRTKGAAKAASTTDKENTEVTDTATTPEDTAPVEATEVTPAANGSEPEKPAVDFEENLYQAITSFTTDRNVENLQTVYRQIPAAARGRLQGSAMKRALNDGVGLDVLGAVLEAISNLPTATKVTRTKPELEPKAEAAVRLVALMNAFDQLKTELGDDAYAQADAWYQADVPEEFKSYVESVTEAVSKATTVKSGSTRGPRRTYTESFADLVQRGAIPVGAILKGSGDVTAEVTAEGKIRTTKGEFEAPSAAASSVHTTKDGKETATNGWAFWEYEGKNIGDYRKPLEDAVAATE